MVLNATFNKMWVILWWSALLVDETEVAGENKNRSLNISNINFYSWNWISSSAPMERRKSVYVKFIERFWIWQDVYGINDSRWSQALASHWQTLLHNVVYSTPRHERDSNSLVVIDTDCTGSCKSNYHTITTIPARVQ